MTQRYELSEAQWQRIESMLPGKPQDPGRTGSDNRTFVNAVLWVLRSGSFWRDLPPRYGQWKTVHQRFIRWARRRVWERLFASLVKDRSSDYLMLDATIVKAHQHAVCGKGGASRRWAAAVAG